MSVSQLLTPNNYNLYSTSLTTDLVTLPSDSGIVATRSDFYYYTKSGNNYKHQRRIDFNYRVKGGLMIIWFNSSTGAWTFDNSLGNEFMFLGPYDKDNEQPKPFDFIPYRLEGDGNICSIINLKNNDLFSTATFFINTDLNNIPGNWEIKIYPSSNQFSIPPVAGTFDGLMNFCNYNIVMPCEPI